MSVTFVTLTPAQRARRAVRVDAWIATLQRQARDDSDIETRDNARALLTARGYTWNAS